MTDPDAIRAEHETMKQRVAALALKYADEYPDLLQDYTLAMLLYVREYDFKMRGRMDLVHDSLNELMLRVVRGEIVNFTSLHRAITAVKRDFQTPDQRKRGLEKEEAWAESFRVDVEGFQ